MKGLNFTISGEYITSLARNWFYNEKRPFMKVMDLLLSSMINPDMTDEERINYAEGILRLEYNLVGSTADGTYGLVEADNKEELKIKYPGYKYFDHLALDSVVPFEKGDYGFINTKGMFIPVDWGEHEEWAADFVKHNLTQEAWMKALNKYSSSTDILVYKMHYILLENPQQGEAIIQKPIKLTKAQKETLYDYLMYHQRQEEALSLWEN